MRAKGMMGEEEELIAMLAKVAGKPRVAGAVQIKGDGGGGRRGEYDAMAPLWGRSGSD